MDFGYSSSASSSPDQRSFVISSMYDTTPDSSTPTSPGELQHMLAYTSFPGYDMAQYQGNSNQYYIQESDKVPVDFPSNTLDEQDRRRKKKAGNAAKETGEVPNMHLRRRAQNRASQRAFRERKERHLKGMEHQLDHLNDKHRDLLASYTRQGDEVVKLNARIQELTSELNRVRSTNDVPYNEMMMPEKFDAIPRTDVTYSGPDFYFDRGVMNLQPGIGQDDIL